MISLNVHKAFHWRLTIAVAAFALLGLLISSRLFTIAIVDHQRYARAAERQHQYLEVLPSFRGDIVMQDKTGTRFPVATQKSFYTLVAVPKHIQNPEDLAVALAPILADKSAEEIFSKLDKGDDPYEVVAKKITEDKASAIRTLEAPGLELVEEVQRNYPQGTFASSLLGFVAYRDGEESGEYGIEKQYQGDLSAASGVFSGNSGGEGYWLALGKRILNPPVDGSTVVLSVDRNIQYRAEQELDKLIEKWKGDLSGIIVMEPKTGKILALASRPTFDPNEYSKVKDYGVFRMPMIDSQFELGSVFKPFTMAMGLNEKVITPQTTYYDPGTVTVEDRRISNFDGKSNGMQTMTQVIEKSLNTGAIFVQQKIAKLKFKSYLESFGFGARTGVDFPGEVAGDMSNLKHMSNVDFATASFGQGIAATPLQVAMAIGAIANKGTLMQPYIVERVIDSNGAETVTTPQSVREVVNPQTAEDVARMMVSAVDHGFDGRASVKGYFVAAKTGTAQIPREDGRGYSEEFIHTFVGFAPAFEPRFSVLIMMRRPQGVAFASNSLTASFHNLSEFILNYYEIPPDRPITK